jgi:hypothetical protein
MGVSVIKMRALGCSLIVLSGGFVPSGLIFALPTGRKPSDWRPAKLLGRYYGGHHATLRCLDSRCYDRDLLLAQRRSNGIDQQMRDGSLPPLQSKGAQAVCRCLHQVQQRSHDDVLDVMHVEGCVLRQPNLPESPILAGYPVSGRNARCADSRYRDG